MLTRKQPRKIVALGMIFLAVASVAQWYLQRHSGLSENVADFGSGVLQGIAIGTLVVGVWLQARERKRG